MNGSWDSYLASPADFAGADDIITNFIHDMYDCPFEKMLKTAL